MVYGETPRKQRQCHCGKPRRPGGNDCPDCHNAYMREWRKTHPDIPLEQRQHAIARSIANVYQRRGKLIPQRCEFEECDAGPGETIKYHDDYSKPLQVHWFCPFHHRRHRILAAESNCLQISD